MNRARAGLQGVRPPVRQGGRVALSAGLFVLAAAVVAACGSSTTPPTEGPSASSPPVTQAPVSVSPSPTPSAVPTQPAPTVTLAPASPTSSAATSACSGNDDNRDFFASFSEAVTWDVYCPRLPDGWFVENGTYRLSGGAWMEIVYRGPGGARFGLREGAFCREEGSDCVPPGTDVGAAAFGDREGMLVAADDGSWAISVDRGQDPSWLATGSGLDEAAFRAHAEALALVDG